MNGGGRLTTTPAALIISNMQRLQKAFIVIMLLTTAVGICATRIALHKPTQPETWIDIVDELHGFMMSCPPDAHAVFNSTYTACDVYGIRASVQTATTTEVTPNAWLSSQHTIETYSVNESEAVMTRDVDGAQGILIVPQIGISGQLITVRGGRAYVISGFFESSKENDRFLASFRFLK
jgi:hypothetical protein